MAQHAGLHLLKSLVTLRRLCAPSADVRWLSEEASGRVKRPVAHPFPLLCIVYSENKRKDGKFIISSNEMTVTGCADLGQLLPSSISNG